MALRLRTILKILGASLLPPSILYRLWHADYRRRPRTDIDTASDLRVMTPQEGVRLEVYWSDVPNVGRGPSASLFVLEEEVVRLDCFGGNDGHMHINPEQVRIILRRYTPRLYFPEGSREDHIERATFELATNTPSALKLNMLARVREFPIDMGKLAAAAGQMADEMNDLLVSHEVRLVPPLPQGVREA